MKAKSISYALLSAALFGVSTPAAKLLLADIDQRILAGLLYCGAGVGVALLRRLPYRLGFVIRAEEATLTKSDWPWMGAATLAGGVAGPLLLMFGLAHAEAATASLLLTLEGVFTAAIAWFVFREPFDRRIALGMAFIVAGSLCLAWSGAPGLSGALGPLAIAAACFAWAIDNNLTRRVSLSDPLQIVEIKGIVAGSVNLWIGLFAGALMPAIPLIGAASVVGFLGYGVSLALFVLALRHLGTARTGAYFSTAPFLGATVSVVVLREPLTLQLVAGTTLMAVGVWLHLTESHEHEHLHESVEHSHSHVHDEHHRHGDHSDHENGQPHTHWHAHEPLLHAHPHMPDTHHRHDH
ncbi:MAG TPA: EamA family transporter [Methylosinus sp.]|jgi:drug/metabolite transporter (DMT)-like permease|uniref:DMT family transporter n=1 Tax=Methylosinus sp. TaxID=427 RepID=UPI002F95BDD6